MKSIRVCVMSLMIGLVVQAAVWSSEPVLEEAATQARRDGQLFAVVIEQEGRQVTVADGDTIELERAPFVIWVVHVAPGGILLQVSSERAVYDAAAFGRTFAEALGSDIDRVMGLAEAEYNLDRTLYVAPYAAHYLPHPRDSIVHRYNRTYIGTSENDFTAGGRDVDFIAEQMDWDVRHEYHVSESPLDELFVTALAVIYDKNYTPNILDYRRVRLVFPD